MRRKLILTLAAVLIFVFVVGLASCTPYHLRPKPSINTENTLEDQYVIKPVLITTARYGEPGIEKPTVSGFKNASRQKTLNARLRISNEIIGLNPETERNEQIYQTYEIWQQNEYLFSCQYITAFETEVSNMGINLLVGSEIDGTLINNLPSLIGRDTESESWDNFMIIFDEAREEAGAKEITRDEMRTDNFSFVFIGDDLTDLQVHFMYKIKGDKEQQDLVIPLEDIIGTFTEKIQTYFYFTTDGSMAYEEYAETLNEYRIQLEQE